MKMIKIVLPIMLVLLMASDYLRAEEPSHKNNPSIEVFPDTSTWVLTRIGGAKARQHTGNKVFVTINKMEQKISGYTSCNFIKGKVSIKDSTIAFTELIIGKRICDETTTELEKVLLDAFQQSTAWRREGNLLSFYSKGILTLEFKNAAGK